MFIHDLGKNIAGKNNKGVTEVKTKNKQEKITFRSACNSKDFVCTDYGVQL